MYRTNGISKKSNVRSVNESFFDSWSADMAYVLGFFAADGCLTKNAKRQNYYIEFVSTDFDVLEKIRTAIQAQQQITKKISSGVDQSRKQGYRIQIGSKKIYNDLLGMGFTPKKSNNVTLPNVPNRYFNHFLRGYFDGDGCISWGYYKPKDRKSKKEYVTIRYTSGSKIYLE